MSNFNLKAKNKKTGEIYRIDDFDKDIIWVREDEWTGFKQKEFNELYEIVEDWDKQALKDSGIEEIDPNHPYGGMEVLDNVPVETWRDRFNNDFSYLDDCTISNSFYGGSTIEPCRDLKDFFQQELERICDGVENIKKIGNNGEGLPFENSPEIYGNQRRESYKKGYNQAIDDIINIIKK